ncbi:MAG: hypothetical protein ACLU9S_08410 [Oscillospiraceae bacterium]
MMKEIGEQALRSVNCNGMGVLVESWEGSSGSVSALYRGGIHEAISYYEDNIFYMKFWPRKAGSTQDMDYAVYLDEKL